MDYEKFCLILNKHIYEDDKKHLLRIITYRDPYFGTFTLLKSRDFLQECLQYLLQCHEIRFGDAIEEVVEAILGDLGYEVLAKSITGRSGEPMSLDQHFTDGAKYYLIEQKVRDDHDSTKKRGQVSNFEAKLEFLQEEYGSKLIGIMYFVDPDFRKNKNYYLKELHKFEQFYGVDLHLFYGKELFEHLGHPQIWDNIILWLERWKDGLAELPEINFDAEPERSFEDIKGLELRHWRKILQDERLWDEGIMRAIFRNGYTLRLLLDYFRKQPGVPYKNLAGLFHQRLQRYYGEEVQ